MKKLLQRFKNHASAAVVAVAAVAASAALTNEAEAATFDWDAGTFTTVQGDTFSDVAANQLPALGVEGFNYTHLASANGMSIAQAGRIGVNQTFKLPEAAIAAYHAANAPAVSTTAAEPVIAASILAQEAHMAELDAQEIAVATAGALTSSPRPMARPATLVVPTVEVENDAVILAVAARSPISEISVIPAALRFGGTIESAPLMSTAVLEFGSDVDAEIAGVIIPAQLAVDPAVEEVEAAPATEVVEAAPAEEVVVEVPAAEEPAAEVTATVTAEVTPEEAPAADVAATTAVTGEICPIAPEAGEPVQSCAEKTATILEETAAIRAQLEELAQQEAALGEILESNVAEAIAIAEAMEALVARATANARAAEELMAERARTAELIASAVERLDAVEAAAEEPCDCGPAEEPVEEPVVVIPPPTEEIPAEACGLIQTMANHGFNTGRLYDWNKVFNDPRNAHLFPTNVPGLMLEGELIVDQVEGNYVEVEIEPNRVVTRCLPTAPVVRTPTGGGTPSGGTPVTTIPTGTTPQLCSVDTYHDVLFGQLTAVRRQSPRGEFACCTALSLPLLPGGKDLPVSRAPFCPTGGGGGTTTTPNNGFVGGCGEGGTCGDNDDTGHEPGVGIGGVVGGGGHTPPGSATSEPVGASETNGTDADTGGDVTGDASSVLRGHLDRAFAALDVPGEAPVQSRNQGAVLGIVPRLQA